MNNCSPLRYPGGKSAIAPVISYAISENGLKGCTYIEPFAGGASVALNLLMTGAAERIVINDADKAVYSFWRSIIESPKWFIEKIKSTPVTIDEWRVQRAVFQQSKKYSKELGFAMFFLNRTNRSGILTAGPIGGYDQTGNYKIDCRFNKESLIKKIDDISKYRRKIRVYNQDISVFLRRYLPLLSDEGDVFIYFDPPYYEKGQRLYLNHFSNTEHEQLSNVISRIECKWIMTYDDKKEIEKLYSAFETCRFSINYSLSNKKKGGELMIFKDASCMPSSEVIKKLPGLVLFEEMKTEN